MTEDKEIKKPADGKRLLILLGVSIVLGWVILGTWWAMTATADPRMNPMDKIDIIELEKQKIDLPKVEDTGGQNYPTSQERLEERYTANREDYDIFLDGKGRDTFGSLPEIPIDFGSIAYLISTGKITSFDEITSDYYLQPEFYPLFVENGLQFYERYDPRYTGTFGFGVYPREQWITASKDSNGSIDFFFKTGWGIETWQGMHLAINSNCEGVTAQIAEPIFVTPPTYPEFCTKKTCGNDWVRKIKVEIEIGKETKTGECLLVMSTLPVSPQQDQEWLEEFGTDYVQGTGSDITVGVPLQIYLEVVE